ncbi:MAG: type II toxin-antitoxin system RelE/ParE family toxin [Emergencia sp.]|nr:type II toxin-antitoxin system RelE/ParE family toxin [Emergencia sp.]
MEYYTVKLTKQAQKQLYENAKYISDTLSNPSAAKRFLNLMEEKIFSLSTMPHRIKLINEEPWKSEGVRVFIVNHYLVYFWIDQENYRVQVFLIICEKMDQLAHLQKWNVFRDVDE